MSRIIITAIGSFSADIVIKNLKKAGHYIIGTDIYNKKWIAQSKSVDCFYQVPKAIEDDYLKTISSICKNEEVDLIIPLTDYEVDVLNTYRNCFDKIGVKVCLSSLFTIDLCRDKYELCEYLNKNGFNNYTIPTYYFQDLCESNIRYPLIAKPVNGRSSIGLLKISDKEELAFYAERIEINNYIFQPLYDGEIITVDVIRDDKSGKIVSIARKELLRTLNGAGVSVHIFSDTSLDELCERLATILEINGCVNFEFILKDNHYFFLECNPRFSGGIAFSCIAGYDFINNHLKCFSNESIDSFETTIDDIYLARKYKEYLMV